eukprot:1734012-Alexandrium_andersonii.AAC.1
MAERGAAKALARLPFGRAYRLTLAHMLTAGLGVGPMDIRRPGNEALLTAWASGRHALSEWRGVLDMP